MPLRSGYGYIQLRNDTKTVHVEITFSSIFLTFYAKHLILPIVSRIFSTR